MEDSIFPTIGKSVVEYSMRQVPAGLVSYRYIYANDVFPFVRCCGRCDVLYERRTPGVVGCHVVPVETLRRNQHPVGWTVPPHSRG